MDQDIPDSASEEHGDPTLVAQVRYTLPRIEEEEWIKANGGGERSVFTNLVGKPEGLAVETESPVCISRKSTPPSPQCSKLTQYPIMSCRVTPEGGTLFNLQWISK